MYAYFLVSLVETTGRPSQSFMSIIMLCANSSGQHKLHSIKGALRFIAAWDQN